MKKRFNFLFLSLLWSFLLMSCHSSSSSPSEVKTTGLRTAREVVASIEMGWNLANTLETDADETAWGEVRTSPEIIRYVHHLGFNAVRVPCAWNLHQNDGIIQPQYMQRVHEVVDYILHEGMYCIINDHWDGGWIENSLAEGYSEDINDRLFSIWTQIACEFATYDDHLLFAALNQPSIGNYYGEGISINLQNNTATLLRYEQTFIDAVRKTGGNNVYRTLVVQVPDADINKAGGYYIALPEDSTADALAVEVHFYDPWQFTGLKEDQEWGKMCYYWGNAHNSEGADVHRNTPTRMTQRYVGAQMHKMYDQFEVRGIPVILGEYGCLYRDNDSLVGDKPRHLASVCDWLYTVTKEAIKNGIAPFLWDCGHGHEYCVVDRKNLTLRCEEMLQAIQRGAHEGKEARAQATAQKNMK